MRKPLLVLMLLFFVVGMALAQYGLPPTEQKTYGKLTVYSDVSGADIYVDAKFVGQDRATISNIPTGKHYVRVVKGGETIQSGIVEVKRGEETIIVAKPKEEKLLQSRRRPNRVLFFGGLTDLEYKSTVPAGQPAPAGTYTFDYKPQYGFGAEVEFPLPGIDVRVDVGFHQNYPAAIAISATGEAELAISTPYINFSKSIFSFPYFRLNGGGGFNYAIFSPGFQTSITIESRLGYQLFLEAVQASGEQQFFVLRAGYAVFNGRGVGSVSTAPCTYTRFPIDITSPGYYFQAAVGYQL